MMGNDDPCVKGGEELKAAAQGIVCEGLKEVPSDAIEGLTLWEFARG
jgi:hypothetical protein